MSLINDVLRDLDKKAQQKLHPGGAQKQGALPGNITQPKRLRTRFLVVALILALLVLPFALIYKYKHVKHSGADVALIKHPQTQTKAQTKTVKDTLAVSKKNITQPISKSHVSKAKTHSKAVLHLTRVVSASHNSPKPATQIVVDTKNMTISHAEDDSSLLQQAYQLMQQGLYNRAINLLEGSATMGNFNPELYRMLALLYKQKGDLQKANYLIDTALSHNPDNLALLMVKARIELSAQAYHQALATLSRQTPNIGSHTDYYALMARLYLELNQDKMAQILYQQLISIQPTRAAWWLGLGMSYEHQNMSDDAANAYRHALQLGGLGPQVQAYIQSHIS